jgi:putative aldouronate transport system permease protein
MAQGSSMQSSPGSQLAVAAPVVRRKRNLRLWLRDNGAATMMSLPGVLLLLVFCYLPMFGIIIAFKEYRFDQGIFGSKWIGLYNFQFLFSSAAAWRITRNTVGYHLIFMSTGMTASLVIALLMNEVQGKFRARFYQSAMFLPYFISFIIVSYFVYAFLNLDNGIVNHILQALGKQTISWYSKPEYWPSILSIVNIWKGTGYGSILYLAVMLGISPEFYEAAKIDGANKWQQIWHITLPMLVPIIMIQVLLSMGSMFRANFGMFYNVTLDRSSLYPTTDVIDTFVYRSLVQAGDIGMSAAAGVYQSVVGFVLVLLSNWAVRRVDPERALF